MVYPHSFRTEHSETRTTNDTYGQYFETVHGQKKIRIQPDLLKLLQYVDSNRILFFENLKEVVAIPSISGELKYYNDVMKMIKFIEEWFVKLAVKYECFNIGNYELEGKKLPLPSIILATVGTDPNKKTVGVYAWLDVKRPVKKNWRTDPWAVKEVHRRLYGSGTSAGKGSLICWLNTIKTFQDCKIALPVNIKFVIESMHYQESKGLEEFLALRRLDFFYNVDYMVVCDSEWIGEKYPCLTYGSVGLLHFKVTITKEEKSETELKDDMNKIFEKVCDDKENILIPKFNDYVQQISPDEEQLYDAIRDFDVEEVRDSLPDYKKNWNKIKLLMQFWRLSSISLNPIEECICEKNDQTKIKRTFIIKIVPKQVVEKVTKLTLQHFNNVCTELKIENKVNVELISASRPWLADIRSPNYEAARKATIQIYKEDPNMIREDRDLKVVTSIYRILDKSVLVLPLGDRNINSGGDNESIGKKHYYEGIKLLCAYLLQISYIDN